MKSWKTTLGGVAAILAGLGLIAKMVSEGNYDAEKILGALTAIGAGFTGIFARDNNVSSEQAGAK
jgi:hypothetical protein